MKKLLIPLFIILILTCLLSLLFNLRIQRDINNKPIWSNNPRDLDRFVNNILDNDLDYTDLILLSDTRQPLSQDDAPYGKVRVISNRESYINVKGGYELPLYLDGRDNVFGVYTEFPSFIGVGQSWDSDLSEKIGEVIGNEKRGTINFEESNNIALIWSAIGDIRSNPLSGRYDEGFAEDPYLASQLMNSLASNIIGSDGFYIKSALMSKHYAVYNSQWFRMPGSYNVSNRALHEYQLPIFLNAIKNGSIVGFMTSYGRTNGIPNAVSPTMNFARRVGKYTPLFITDYGAPINMVAQFAQGSFSNGVDSSYVPNNEHMSALFAKAGSPKGIYNYSGEPGYPTKKESIDGVKSGLFNLTIDDLKEAVRPVLELYVRLGYFNKDKSSYPYINIMNEMADNFTDEHKEVAYKAALSSIVLLKNSNSLLPIESSSNLNISGPMADSRFKAVYSVKEKSYIPNTGLTPLQSIESDSSGIINFKTSGRVVRLKAKSNNNYITSKDGNAVANKGSIDDAELFEIFDFGQNAYSLRSLTTGRWVGTHNGKLKTNLFVSYFSNSDSEMPERLRLEKNQDGSYSIVVNSFSESFVESNAVTYYQNGKLIEVSGNNELVSSKIRSERGNNLKFYIEDVSQPGESIEGGADYAIVVIGTPTRNSSGEGMDRSSLSLGDDQYTLVERVSEKYPGKTIVILKSNYPVLMDKIEKNSNVAAILFQPYGGQYDGKALSDVIFGSSYPSGRLVSTWYSSDSVFQDIDDYSIPEGVDLTLDDIDPRIKFDYTNADPMESRLTYMYKESDITYPFGFGRSYSNFKLNNLVVNNKVNGKKSFQVELSVTNLGEYSTEDVIQVYIKDITSRYGNYVPLKKLVGFKKVFIKSGETRNISITVDPVAFAKLEVVSQKMVVEEGMYQISVGHSSQDSDALKKSIFVSGTKFPNIKLEDFTNIWDYSYASNNLIYKEASKERTTNYIGEYYSVMSKDSDSWVAIPNVEFKNKRYVDIKAGNLLDKELKFSIHLDSPTGEKVAEFTVGNSGIREYRVPSLDGSGEILREVNYKVVSSDLTKSINGVHNLYILFSDSDIRLESIRLR